MGNKFEVWNDKNWEMRQTGGTLSTEILGSGITRKFKNNIFLIRGKK